MSERRACGLIGLARTNCPFVGEVRMDESVRLLKGIPKVNCSVSLKRIGHEHLFRAPRLDPENREFTPFLTDADVGRFQSRQDFPELWCTSGANYARWTELLEDWEGKDFCLGFRPVGICLEDLESANIDRPIDFEFAEFMVRKQIEVTFKDLGRNP